MISKRTIGFALLGIVHDGYSRLRAAVEEEVRREHADELAAATEHWQRAELEEKIQQEVSRRMESLASPYSLWSTLCFGLFKLKD
jgi:hypothetical protein